MVLSNGSYKILLFKLIQVNSKTLTDKNENQVKGPLLVELKSFDDNRDIFTKNGIRKTSIN